MAGVLTKERAKALEDLNSEVRFNNIAGEIRRVRAELYLKGTSRQWLSAEEGSEELALDLVLEQSKTARRPAETAQGVQQELDETKVRMAEQEQEIARLRAQVSARTSDGRGKGKSKGAKPDADPEADPAADPEQK